MSEMRIVQAPQTDAYARTKKKAQAVYEMLARIKAQVARVVEDASTHPGDYEHARKLSVAELNLKDVLDNLM